MKISLKIKLKFLNQFKTLLLKTITKFTFY